MLVISYQLSVVSCKLQLKLVNFTVPYPPAFVESVAQQLIPDFILASASPTRRAVLQNAGITPIICVSDFDESQVQITDPVQLVKTLALCKAEAVTSLFVDRTALILGCDSVLVLEQEIYGKPSSREDAIAMWQKMRGNQGQIYTGHSLIDIQNQRTLTTYNSTTVHFVNATDQEIISYIDTGEPMNCAGCFTLEGLGGLLIEKLEGCHTNVLGLSLPLLRQMLREFGYSLQFTKERQVEIKMLT